MMLLDSGSEAHEKTSVLDLITIPWNRWDNDDNGYDDYDELGG